MDNNQTRLDTLFQALADPTRRAVISRLGTGPASVSELATPFDMALPSFMKHIRYLEESGWITSRKQGRVRICNIVHPQMQFAIGWLDRQRVLWEQQSDRLEDFVTRSDQKDQTE